MPCRVPWFTIAIAGMLLGEGPLFLMSSMLFVMLILLVIGYAVYVCLRPVFRAIFPKRQKINECSPELLALWKERSDWMRAHPGRIFPD